MINNPSCPTGLTRTIRQGHPLHRVIFLVKKAKYAINSLGFNHRINILGWCSNCKDYNLIYKLIIINNLYGANILKILSQCNKTSGLSIQR